MRVIVRAGRDSDRPHGAHGDASPRTGETGGHPDRHRGRHVDGHTASRRHGHSAEHSAHAQHRAPRWRLDTFALAATVIGVIGLLAISYPNAAAWLAQVNQAAVISGYLKEDHRSDAENALQLAAAREYNDALKSGALLEPNVNVPTGDGSLASGKYRYEHLLRANASGLMARLQIPRIDVDIPVYHGTGDVVLLHGAGHLEGTSLPVGGASTRTVITAHRGLANACMFTDLDQLEVGDTFTFEVFGEVLSYRVFETKVVAPEDTASLRVTAGRDLATLVTCTPLGVNSHRILVTGERIFPTPEDDVQRATSAPEIPRFPWWAVWIAAGFLLLALYLWRAGRATSYPRSSAPDPPSRIHWPGEY